MLCRRVESPEDTLRESYIKRAFTGFRKLYRLPNLARTDKLSRFELRLGSTRRRSMVGH